MRNFRFWTRIVLIGIAFVSISASAVPVMAGGPPVDWSKIALALKAVMMAKPSGTYSVIIEVGHSSPKVKFILKNTMSALPGNVNINTGGKGLVNAYAAVTSNTNGRDNVGLRPSDSFCVNVYAMIKGSQPLVWKDPHYMGIDWTNLSWDNLSWDNLSWDNLSWDSSGNWDSTQSSVNWQSASTID